MYTFVRRPTYILDFSLTLIMNHLILTTYYSASFPSSLFFWLVMLAGAILLIAFAEQLCVRREMKEGMKTVGVDPDAEDDHNDIDTENMELGELMRSHD